MRLLVLALSFFCVSAFAQTGGAKKAYLMANVQIKKGKTDTYMNDYIAKVGPLLAQAGAKLLVGTPETTAIEGKWKGNWNIVVEFPSKEAAQKFYGSPEYQALKKIRMANSDWATLVLWEGAGGPAPATTAQTH